MFSRGTFLFNANLINKSIRETIPVLGLVG